MNERFANLMRLFSWPQLLGMKLAGQLKVWVDRPSVRYRRVGRDSIRAC